MSNEVQTKKATDYVEVKQIDTQKLVYDIKSLPKGLDASNLVKLYQMQHLVFWDSSKEGVKPALYGVDSKAPLMIVDVKGKEIDLDYYTKKFQEEEYWDKELHKARTSPVYYFSNYATTKWPVDNDDLKNYLKDIDIKRLAAKDSEHAKKLWEEQRDKIKEATKHVTLEHLKERKAVIDSLKQIYEHRLLAMEDLLRPHVKLNDTKGEPLEAKQKALNIIEKIKRALPVPLKYTKNYRLKKGRWDLAALRATDYGVLLEMYYDILKTSGKVKDVLDSESK